MQKYLTYAPILIFILWLYLCIQNFKTFAEIKRASGKKYVSLFFSPSLLLGESNNPDLNKAIQNHKRNSKRLIKIWALSLLAFILISIIVGILTANSR